MTIDRLPLAFVLVIDEQPRPYPHLMIYLVKAIETLMHTCHTP